MARTPINTPLAKGVSRLSRHQAYAQRYVYKRPKSTKTVAVTPKVTTKTKTVKGDKNGGSRIVPLQKTSRFYPADHVPRPLANHKTAGIAKLRKSITPGTVLTVLSGKFRGKV